MIRVMAVKGIRGTMLTSVSFQGSIDAKGALSQAIEHVLVAAQVILIVRVSRMQHNVISVLRFTSLFLS